MRLRTLNELQLPKYERVLDCAGDLAKVDRERGRGWGGRGLGVVRNNLN